MKRFLFLSLALASTMMIYAQLFGAQKTIHVTPDKAKIFVDGNEVGNGSYTVKFNNKTDFYVLKFVYPGYITKQVKLFKNNPNKTISYTMAKDEFFMNSVGPNGEDAIDVANKWFEVTAKQGMSEDKVWKRLMGIASKYFETIEVRDKSAGWIKTAWKKKSFAVQTVRTRLEIKINTDDDEQLSYKVKLYSEVNDDPDCFEDECFVQADRILKDFVQLINELQNKIN